MKSRGRKPPLRNPKVPDIRTEIPGPKARAIVERDTGTIATSTKTSPIVARRARGAVVEDVDGNLFLDFASGVGVTNVGHCHPAVVGAVQRQAAELMHFAGTDFYYERQVELAERLAGITPGGFGKKVFFTNSGTESVEAALKVARWSSRKGLFIGFLGAFHGRTMGSLAVTASKPVQRERYLPMMPGVVHVPYANCYRCPYHLEYPSCGVWCAHAVEELYLSTVAPPADTAAIIMEPVQGEGGYVFPPPEFIRILRQTADRNGLLLIDDEVQAGFGRTGRMFAIEHAGVVPDILATAKGIASGMPMGAAVFRADLDFGRQGAHSNTFGGNPVACAAALATLDIIKNERLLENAVMEGAHFRKRLQELSREFEVIGDVRGLGLMLATELVEDRKTKVPAKKRRDRVVEEAMKRGLILLPCGKSSIRYLPPLNVAPPEIDAGADVLREAFRRSR